MIRVDAIEMSAFDPGGCLAMHRHANAYAAIVVEGRYEETSLDGRYACGPGDVIIHPCFHAHADEFGPGSGRVLNIPLPSLPADGAGLTVFAAPDPDALIRLAHDRPGDAPLAVLEEADGRDPLEPPPWLAAFLAAVLAGVPVARSALSSGVSPEHASRVCRRWFGCAPVELRREDRIRRAIDALRDGASPAEAALIAEFSDQPHLTRVLKAATGLTPGRLQLH